MNVETPLVDVARMLPKGAAVVLTAFEYPVQESVLRQMRTALTSLEQQSIVLDPIELEAVLNVFVGSVAPLTDALYRIGKRAP